jgi:hypothetical protein
MQHRYFYSKEMEETHEEERKVPYPLILIQRIVQTYCRYVYNEWEG